VERALLLEKRKRTEPVPKVGASTEAVTEDDVTIILPVLNEEGAIGSVLDDLIGHGYRKILVVDGYSTDSTLENVHNFGVEMIHQHGTGKAGAIRTALEHVFTPYVMIIDGDCTYRARDIEKFLLHAINYDEIIGSREKSSKNMSWLHRLGNRVITRTFNMLMGANLSDVCSGMYLLNAASAKQLDLRTGGFNVEVEVAAQMLRQGNITEVPIGYDNRVGKQKVSTWRHGLGILASVVKLARIHNPAFFYSLIAASAGIPGAVIILWTLMQWFLTGAFHSGWALAGTILFLFALQSLTVGTISVLLKHTEARITKRFQQRVN